MKQIVSAAIASMSAFIFSYSLCIIAGILPLIVAEWNLSTFQEGAIASATFLGAWIGAGSCSPLIDRLGRKKCFFLNNLLYLGCSGVALLIKGVTFLIVLRFLNGFAMGMTSLLVPLYLAEIAPASKRGVFVTLYSLTLSIATLTAYLATLGVATWGWRILLFSSIIPVLLQLGLIPFLLESDHGHIAANRPPKICLRELLSPVYRPTLRLGVAIAAIQQLCGLNAIILFAPQMFNTSSQGVSMLPAIEIGSVNVLANLISAFLIDRYGRRSLYLVSLIGSASSLLAMALCFALASIPMSLVFCMTYIFFFSLGLGPITWVLLSEIVPCPIRAKVLSWLTCCNWAAAAFIVFSFPFLFSRWGLSATLGFYAFFAIGSFLFFFRSLPETKGKTLEELAAQLYQTDTNHPSSF